MRYYSASNYNNTIIKLKLPVCRVRVIFFYKIFIKFVLIYLIQLKIVNFQRSSEPYLSIVVVGSAVFLLNIFSSGCEEGQRVEVLMGGLLPTCH